MAQTQPPSNPFIIHFEQDACDANQIGTGPGLGLGLGPAPLKILWNVKNISGHIVDIAMPTKRHCGVQFFVHDFQRFGHAGLAHGTEAVDIGFWCKFSGGFTVVLTVLKYRAPRLRGAPHWPSEHKRVV